MSRRHILPSLAALVAVALTIAGTLLAASPSMALRSETSTTPKVGQCRNLTGDDAAPMSNNSHTVPCTSTHTTRTYAVALIPKGTPYKNLTPEAFSKIGTSVCQPRLGDILGDTETNRAMTAYDFVFFAPTQSQRNAGARWVRCDLILAGGLNLLPLPSNDTPVIGGPPSDVIARCLVSSYHLRTTCDHNHQYRASAAYVLPGTGYRTPMQFAAAGAQRCPDAEYFTWPGKQTWGLGDHVLVCYDKTKS